MTAFDRDAPNTPDEPQEDPLLAGAWALDALDEDERTGYEERLRRHPDERVAADELRETAARLGAAAAVPPPRRLRAEVLAAISATVQEAPAATSAPVASVSDLDVVRRRRRGHLRIDALVAAAAVVVAVAGVGIGLDGRHDARQAQQQTAVRQAADRSVTGLLSSPGASAVTVAASAGGSATVVRRGTEAAVLTNGVPAAGSGRTYQLWLTEGGRAVSAGLLSTDGSGASTTVVADTGSATGVAISLEPAGGSQRPTTTPVVTASFTA